MTTFFIYHLAEMSAIVEDLKSEPLGACADSVPPLLPREVIPRRRRVMALVVVLSVGFAHFVVASAYYSFGGSAYSDPHQNQFRLLGGLITEATSLLLLWYVLSEHKTTWSDIGWNPAWTDIGRGLWLIILTVIGTFAVMTLVQLVYHLYTGHYLQTRSLKAVYGFGVSALSIAFICINPFFEELIVRAYTMSEVVNLGGSAGMAVVASVALQMSYHLYQGLASGIALTVLFTLFSIYYMKTHRIAPVILAHFFFDAYALLKGIF